MMISEAVVEPINVLLSREELLFVLNLLQANSIPGLDADPAGVLNEEQRTLALMWGERALRARELAQIREDRGVVVHNALLTAVGVCAYSNHALFIYHWSGQEEAPTRYFAHLRNGDIAVHTRPEDVLHLFTLLPSREHLFTDVLTVCEYDDVAASEFAEMTVTENSFIRARELVGKGDIEVAARLLVNDGATDAAALAYVGTLANSPRISIFQTFRQEGETAVQKGDFTVVQDGQHAWLIAPAASDNGNPSLFIKPTTRDEIEALLAELI